MSRAPFRIEKLKIRDFRGIDELDLNFGFVEGEPGGLSVLAGDNGVGKTAILEAILLVLGKTDLLPADAALIEEQVRFGAKDFSIEVQLGGSDGFSTELRVDAETIAMGPHVRMRMRPLFKAEPRTKREEWAKIEAVAANAEYFSSRREPIALGGEPHLEAAHSEREAIRISELKWRLKNTFYRGLRARQASPADSPAFARLQSFVRRFMGDEWTLDILPVSNDPGSGDDVVVRRGELPADITSIAMAREAAKSRTDIPTILPIDRLSSGQLSLFAFAGPLVFRDAPADVVLIDEPEQHMHVSWQRHFMSWLRELSPQSHFIVSTHSVEILHSVFSYERFILVPEDDPRAFVGNDDEPDQAAQ